ncbi:MAG: DUF512 domain-containing protein [Clostridiales bacterium]|jgi:putative radical SAM enzyme (TIGR03279 family)|nr:DUF512 domain-containing protein [Clostridiales bacterium]
MKHLIADVLPGSPADKAGVRAGDFLVSVDGREAADVLDYRYLIQEADGLLVQRAGGGAVTVVTGGEDPGLAFETGLMDKAKPCRNDCVFCFIAQNPPGLRDTLYFKDDDWRLSFLTGNYISTTNMKTDDFKRLAFYHLSPINISVHAVTPRVRRMMTRNPKAGRLMNRLRFMKRRGITMNFQIVLCKGINDGPELIKTIKALARLKPQAASLSVVPVGLTAYRDNLYHLEPFTSKDADAVIDTVEGLHGGFVWAADEFYVLAGRKIPDYGYYIGFPQLENGVGMMALFEKEYIDRLNELDNPRSSDDTLIITGMAAFGFIKGLVGMIPGAEVLPVKNVFFGETVTVAGLLAGRDIILAAKRAKENKERLKRLLIPRSALRAGEDVFLDGMSLEAVAAETGLDVRAVEVDGAALVNALLCTESK